MSVPAGQAALLGTLQGITEFLPVSSSGHLALAELLFDVEEGGLAFNVMLHAGTLLATLIMLRRRVAPAVVEGSRALVRPQRFRESAGGRDALVVLLASLPTAAIGLALRSAVEEFTKSPSRWALASALPPFCCSPPAGRAPVSARFPPWSARS